MADGKVVGYIPGGWDLFHIGHLAIVQRARPLCDYLIAGVATDEMLERAKGRKPFIPLVERLAIVAALRDVDEAVVDTDHSKLVAHAAHPFDVLFKGDDWRGTAKGDRLEAEMATVGVRVHYLPYSKQTSSSRLRAVLERELRN